MDRNKATKDQLLAHCEELTNQNAELVAKNAELVAKNAELAAEPKGNANELQQQLTDLQEQLSTKEQEVNDLQGVVTSLNEKLVLEAKTRGSNNPCGTIEVDGKKITLEVVHGLRKGQKNHTKQEIADDAAWLAALYTKKSTAVRVVA